MKRLATQPHNCPQIPRNQSLRNERPARVEIALQAHFSDKVHPDSSHCTQKIQFFTSALGRESYNAQREAEHLPFGGKNCFPFPDLLPACSYLRPLRPDPPIWRRVRARRPCGISKSSARLQLGLAMVVWPWISLSGLGMNDPQKCGRGAQ